MTSTQSTIDGKRIVIGITGGIACYKVANLVSTLVQSGAIVDVLMTDAATRFVAPLTFASLTGRPVFDDQWKHIDGYSPQHIQFASNADAMLIAPCTMNMLGKLASGITDNSVTLVCAAINREHTPVLVAPAMNATMLNQPATQRNINTLHEDGYTILNSDDGWQACGAVGKGRMLEPEALFCALTSLFIK